MAQVVRGDRPPSLASTARLLRFYPIRTQALGISLCPGWQKRRERSWTSLQPAQLLEVIMLWTIILILLVLWVVGLVSATTMGGLIHLLLLVAVVVLVIQLLQGRRVL